MVDTETHESSDEWKADPSRAVRELKQHIKDGSLPIAAGATLVMSAFRGRRRTASRVLAGAALIGIGIRQRRHNESIAESTAPSKGAHGATGTVEQRADSHRGDENPRGTATDPEIDRQKQSGKKSVQFTDSQEESKESPDIDSDSGSDPRIDDDTTTPITTNAPIPQAALSAFRRKPLTPASPDNTFTLDPAP